MCFVKVCNYYINIEYTEIFMIIGQKDLIAGKGLKGTIL